MIELNKRKHFIKDTKESIERKEKEISRLSFLAEQDKTTGMFLCQQISREYERKREREGERESEIEGYEADQYLLFLTELKRSLEGFLQAREESKPETLCNVSLFLLLLLFPLPLPPSPSPFPFSLSILIAIEMHHSKILARCSSDLFGLSDGSPSGSPAPCGVPSPHHHPFVAGLLCTAIGKETEAVMLEDEKRSQELARVKLIVAHESKRVDSLKAKVQGKYQVPRPHPPPSPSPFPSPFPSHLHTAADNTNHLFITSHHRAEGGAGGGTAAGGRTAGT